MKFLVTGATGFVGRHVTQELLRRGHNVTVVTRHRDRILEMPWQSCVEVVSYDIHTKDSDVASVLGIPDILVHLAWPGLPHYKELFHFEENLPADYRFLKQMIFSGVKNIVITGTCLEYGMQSGSLEEELPTLPVTPYGLAKDTLRKFLQELQAYHPYILQWARLFYLHGPGQNSRSLLACLDRAIENGDQSFNMSGGEQLRDYLPVEEAAKRLVLIAEHPECSGIINCCSGESISVKNLVEQRIKERGAKINLNVGYFPYPDYEPMAFWGNVNKLQKILDL